MNDLPANPELVAFAFILLMTRVAAFILTFPIFGRDFLPRMIKLGFCLSLTIVWLPQFIEAGHGISKVTWVTLTIGITWEAMIGSALGLVLGLMMLPMRLAGIYVGQEMGFNLGGITAPGSTSSSNEIGAILEALGILLLFVTETHHTVLAALYATVIHPGAVENLRTYAEGHYAHGLTQAHEVSLLVVAPISICLFVTTVVLGVSMKAVPNVNLFSVGIPLRFIIGFIALLAFLPDILGKLTAYFESQQHIFHWLF